MQNKWTNAIDPVHSQGESRGLEWYGWVMEPEGDFVGVAVGPRSAVTISATVVGVAGAAVVVVAKSETESSRSLTTPTSSTSCKPSRQILQLTESLGGGLGLELEFMPPTSLSSSLQGTHIASSACMSRPSSYSVNSTSWHWPEGVSFDTQPASFLEPGQSKRMNKDEEGDEGNGAASRRVLFATFRIGIRLFWVAYTSREAGSQGRFIFGKMESSSDISIGI